jgi:hypothetical protein
MAAAAADDAGGEEELAMGHKHVRVIQAECSATGTYTKKSDEKAVTRRLSALRLPSAAGVAARASYTSTAVGLRAGRQSRKVTHTCDEGRERRRVVVTHTGSVKGPSRRHDQIWILTAAAVVGKWLSGFKPFFNILPSTL